MAYIDYFYRYGGNAPIELRPKKDISSIKIMGTELSSNDGSVDLPYSDKKKINDYLYSIRYGVIDYKFANGYFRKNYGKGLDLGRCSSVRSGMWYGRNLDWYYADQVSFVVRVPSTDKRYASVGVATTLPKMTKEFVESGRYDDVWKILPFQVVDAINECGVTVNINVVPKYDMGNTTGTNPGKPELCMMMMPRYIVDNFSTAREACEYIRDNMNVYSPQTDLFMYELHCMVSDEKETLIMEFVDNKCVILEGQNVMTNFYLSGVDVESGKVDYRTVTPYGMGIERYEYGLSRVPESDSKEGMMETMDGLFCTRTYDRSENPFWLTDYTTQKYGLTVQKAYEEPEAFNYVVDKTIEAFEHRTRDTKSPYYGTWHTTTCSIYDIENRHLWVLNEEGNLGNDFIGFGINVDYDYLLDIAPGYSKKKTYKEGDVVIYGYGIYKCKSDISVPECFDFSKWKRIMVSEI